MDWQALFNIAAGISGALGGWMLHIVWQGQSEQRRDLSNLQVHIPQHYISKEDYKEDFRQVLSKLDKIQEMLERKQDKE